jgi:hypothetical protein
VLVEQVAGALGAPFLQIALGFGFAEPGPIGVGLLRRFVSFDAFPESLQVDYVPHACLHNAINLGREGISQKPGMIAPGVSLLGCHPDIPVNSPFVTSKILFRCAKTNNCCSATPRRNDNR